MRSLLLTAAFVFGFCNADKIQSLPGFTGTIGFDQYSGYLQASSSHFLHYWFTESQSQPDTDPFVVWLNGGPGCSSLMGLLTELGPFIVQDENTLQANPSAWNKQANVLFLEAPAGVGYSYSTGSTSTDDDKTSRENYAALKDFFTKFPQFKNHDIYITGESYAGIYVPTFVSRIIDGQSDYPLSLKGMVIGNGCVKNSLDINSLVEFAYGHGLVSEKRLTDLKTCCNGCFEKCDFDNLHGHCSGLVRSVYTLAWFGGMNPYGLYDDCYHGGRMSLRYMVDLEQRFPKEEIEEQLANMPDNPKVSIPCLNENGITGYLNRHDVREALFIPSHVHRWAICSRIGYRRQYNDMTPQVQKALQNNVRVLIYNGDTDMACNYLMGQRFSAAMGQSLETDKKKWHFNDQVAGFVTKYEKLQFVTIKGAGHTVPSYKPGASLKMFNSFLKDRDLSKDIMEA